MDQKPNASNELDTWAAQHVYAAARADMEFRTSLTAARHHLENLLTAFSHAVCNQDTHALGELTNGVEVSMNGHTPSGSSKPAEIIGWFTHAGPATIQTTTNISLRIGETTVFYTATYQDWEPGPAPRCTAIGKFHGQLKTGPQVWRWKEHTITKLDSQTEHHEGSHNLTSQPIFGQRILHRTS